MPRFSDVPKMVLGPLTAAEADWYRAPAGNVVRANRRASGDLDRSTRGEFDKRERTIPWCGGRAASARHSPACFILGLGCTPGVQGTEGRAGAGITRARGGRQFKGRPRQWDELQHMLLPARRYDLVREASAAG